MLQFFPIIPRHDNVASGDFFRVKEGQQLLRPQGFRLVELPQEPGQIAQERFRAVAKGTQEARVAGFFALGQAAAVGGDEKGQVQVRRRTEAEEAGQVELRRGGTEQVPAADDLAYALESVVDGDGQLVGEDAVAAPDDDVPPVRG